MVGSGGSGAVGAMSARFWARSSPMVSRLTLSSAMKRCRRESSSLSRVRRDIRGSPRSVGTELDRLLGGTPRTVEPPFHRPHGHLDAIPQPERSQDALKVVGDRPGLSTSRAAISALLRPSATRAATSCSRGLSFFSTMACPHQMQNSRRSTLPKSKPRSTTCRRARRAPHAVAMAQIVMSTVVPSRHRGMHDA